MKHRNWIHLIVALNLLLGSTVLMFHPQPIASAHPLETSQAAPAGAVIDNRLAQRHDTLHPAPSEPDPERAVLYPDDMDPPETCGLPTRGPFGQDVEILVGPWANERSMYQLSLMPSWNDQEPLTGATPTWEIAAVAQGSEQIVAAWADIQGNLRYSVWSMADNSWSASPYSLDMWIGGNPALLSRNAYNWAGLM